jgi:hypothetical protein
MAKKRAILTPDGSPMDYKVEKLKRRQPEDKEKDKKKPKKKAGKK